MRRSGMCALKPPAIMIPFPSAKPPDDLAAVEWAVPEFTHNVLRARQSRYAICLFVINERERIQRQLARMAQCRHDLDVVIADGGSTDGSLEPNRLREL